jgi:hypothetical protein
MPEQHPQSQTRPSNESPYLVFKGSDLTIEGDPSTAAQFALTFAVLENLTNYLVESDLWPELEPQMVKEDLDHFNGWLPSPRFGMVSNYARTAYGPGVYSY